ncbi:hypothetical protein [Spartinivicinus poritis]|uniref:Uncharacterized protein n=1 Tax=Spartinivicinus poritis TaxID=2994640 RepID=A0ABT5UH60_9GAMM|nr:hypothetical protein [Spartinivicinus sp. A2-2]MDE1465731.1 hypothetical protein [Spartinivicinus sp. A2-2]
MSDNNEEKLVCFRLAAEMDNGQLYAVSLNDQQQLELHRALEQILGDQPLRIHAVPFGTSSSMVPELH